MKTLSFSVLIIFSLDFFPSSFSQLGRNDYFEIITLFKRFGTECILSDGVNKGNTKKVVEKIIDVDKNLAVCFERLKNSFTEIADEEAELKIKQDTIKDSKNLLTNQVRKHCKVMNDLTECLQPLQDTFRKCKHTEGVALLTFVKEACKENGGPALEFVTAADKYCVELELKNPRAFQNCLDKNFNSKTKDLWSFITKDICGAATDFKECGLVYLDQCKSTEPKKILETYMNELKNKSPEVNKCFFHDSSLQDEQKPSESAPTSTTKPAKFKTSGKRKHSRPKYVW